MTTSSLRRLAELAVIKRHNQRMEAAWAKYGMPICPDCYLPITYHTKTRGEILCPTSKL